MKVVDVSCPFCGANVGITATEEFVTCEHCGKQIFVDDEVERVEHHFSAEDAEEMGYQFEKGRQRAKEEKELEEVGSQWLPPYRNNPYSDYGQEFQKTDTSAEVTPNQSKAGCGTYLLWFLFFPIMFLYWLATTERLSKKAKIIISVIIVAVGLFGGDNKSKTSTQSVTPTTSVTNTGQADTIAKTYPYDMDYDALQKLFLQVSDSMSVDEVVSLLENEAYKSIVYAKKKYNGYDQYTFAYSEDIVNGKRGASGDYVTIDYDYRRNNAFMQAVYHNHTTYDCAILFRYGYYFELGSSQPNDETKWGYYYYSTKLQQYKNGRSEGKPYEKCADAKEAIYRASHGE